MKETYTIKQSFKFLEYMRVAFFIAFKMKIIRRVFVIIGTLSFLSTILNLFFLNTDKGFVAIILQSLIFPIGAIFLFFSILITVVLFFIFKYKPHVFQGYHYIYNHWGLEKQANGINTSVPWSFFLSIKETKRFFFFFIKQNEVVVVQKRMFADQNELDGFRNFVENNSGLNF